MESTLLSGLEVIYKPLDALKPNPNNARTHSKRQIKMIAESIRVFGFTNPVLVDSNKRIIAGHGRVEAGKLLGMTQVPTICLESLTEEQVRAYVIADNKLAENAGWDRSILAIELQHLLTLECADFDVTITGFEVAEVDEILAEVNETTDAEPPIPEPVWDRPPIMEPGDLWFVGKHRILCGDSLKEDSYKTLMGRRKAAIVFSDPPYNVRIDGNVCGKGSVCHREFQMASGEMSEPEFVSFLSTSLRWFAKYSVSESVHFLCMDWRHMKEMLAAGGGIYDSFVNLCVWVKGNGGMGSFYRSRHELIFVFRNGRGPHRNNIQLGKFGQNRTNVWEYPGMNTFSKQGEEGNLLSLHPTVKPVQMVADAILDCSARGDTVLDGFLGSGSTLMAAERVGRVCYGIEIEPVYLDVAIRRWQNFTGEAAVHGQTGKRFDEVTAQKEERG